MGRKEWFNGRLQPLNIFKEIKSQTKEEETTPSLYNFTLQDQVEVPFTQAETLMSPKEIPYLAMKRQLKEKTRPTEFKLHTQTRAIKRAAFNNLIATKIQLLEERKRQEEIILKIMEKEEIKILRKEMIPRANLMPFFDRPFFPQRSTKKLTVPKEPIFHVLSNPCSRRMACGTQQSHA